jgi:hypothetical protein
MFDQGALGVCADASTQTVYASDTGAHRVLAFKAL